ncbi:hypothetical protein COO60DRAFT_1135630 [Scenedesmus sp. NREL 46B-D3]|nr:hypothetical protein COO60DRAFT_1135630 [Scenedesmus sp. NREL 46B-D3]
MLSVLLLLLSLLLILQTPTQPAIDISSDHEDTSLQAGPSRQPAAKGPSRAAAAAAAGSKPGGSSQETTAIPNGQDASKAGSSAAAAAAAGAAAGGIAAAAAINRSELQLILPEKLVRHKVLIELEPAPHQATELSGDAGAVGRLVASSSTAEDGQFKLDLKGVIYQATVLPLAGSVMVVNIGPTEAKASAERHCAAKGLAIWAGGSNNCCASPMHHSASCASLCIFHLLVRSIAGSAFCASGAVLWLHGLAGPLPRTHVRCRWSQC